MNKNIWIPPEKQSFFVLSPFQVIGEESIDILRKSTSTTWLLVSYFDDEARLRRLRATIDGIETEANCWAQQTGDTVLIAQNAGLARDGRPVFRSVGRILTAKSDALSDEAFLAWARKLAGDLEESSKKDISSMITRIIGALPIDFESMDSDSRESFLAKVERLLATPSPAVLQTQERSIRATLQRVISAVTRSAALLPQMQGKLSPSFRLHDKKISRLLASHHSFWARDAQGRICQTLSAQLRPVISQGVAQGLGRQHIANQIRATVRGGLERKNYWEIVAANHIARARSYSLGSSMQAAGITHYKIEAVLDDRTTHQCLYLHGKVLPVGGAMAHVDRILESKDPKTVLWSSPFIRDRGSSIEIDYPDGTSRRVATIEQRSTGMSPRGPTALFSRGLSPTDLIDAAIGLPPYHFGCRTTVVPI